MDSHSIDFAQWTKKTFTNINNTKYDFTILNTICSYKKKKKTLLNKLKL